MLSSGGTSPCEEIVSKCTSQEPLGTLNVSSPDFRPLPEDLAALIPVCKVRRDRHQSLTSKARPSAAERATVMSEPKQDDGMQHARSAQLIHHAAVM